jgi:hypothetical protein
MCPASRWTLHARARAPQRIRGLIRKKSHGFACTKWKEWAGCTIWKSPSLHLSPRSFLAGRELPEAFVGFPGSDRCQEARAALSRSAFPKAPALPQGADIFCKMSGADPCAGSASYALPMTDRDPPPTHSRGRDGPNNLGRFPRVALCESGNPGLHIFDSYGVVRMPRFTREVETERSQDEPLISNWLSDENLGAACASVL